MTHDRPRLPLAPEGFVYPKTDADLAAETSEERRYRRAVFARVLALDGVPVLEICRRCDMNARSLERILSGLSFADAPYPLGLTRRHFVDVMREKGYVQKMGGRDHEDRRDSPPRG